MSRRRASFVAGATVLLASAVGQLLAGDDPAARLESLPETALSLPLSIWIAVAVVYYAMSATVLYRLLRAEPSTRPSTIWYLVLVAANEVWNALLFVPNALWPAVVGMLAFAAVTVAVGIVLWRGDDRVAFWLFAPYLAWVVGYDVPWIVTTWIADR